MVITLGNKEIDSLRFETIDDTDIKEKSITLNNTTGRYTFKTTESGIKYAPDHNHTSVEEGGQLEFRDLNSIKNGIVAMGALSYNALKYGTYTNGQGNYADVFTDSTGKNNTIDVSDTSATYISTTGLYHTGTVNTEIIGATSVDTTGFGIYCDTKGYDGANITYYTNTFGPFNINTMYSSKDVYQNSNVVDFKIDGVSSTVGMYGYGLVTF